MHGLPGPTVKIIAQNPGKVSEVFVCTEFGGGEGQVGLWYHSGSGLLIRGALFYWTLGPIVSLK